jgi:hypothetical protein
MGVGISCIFGLSLLVGRPREMGNKLKTSYPMKVERETKKLGRVALKIVGKRRLAQETTGFSCVLLIAIFQWQVGLPCVFSAWSDARQRISRFGFHISKLPPKKSWMHQDIPKVFDQNKPNNERRRMAK